MVEVKHIQILLSRNCIWHDSLIKGGSIESSHLPALNLSLVGARELVVLVLISQQIGPYLIAWSYPIC